MQTMELEQENKLQNEDIQHISEFVVNAIKLDDPVTEGKVVDSKAFILDSLSNMLETMLSKDSSMSKVMKLEIVHMLTKLKANKEYLNIVKATLKGDSDALADVYNASKRMFDKSQSAFNNNGK